MQGRCPESEGGGVNALEGGGGAIKKNIKIEKVGVYNPPPSSYGSAPRAPELPMNNLKKNKCVCAL